MIEIKWIKEENRVVAYDNEIEIGKCEFKELGDTWNIVHTVVNSQYQGQGIAKKLVKCVIENSEKCNKNLIAECSYAKKVLEANNITSIKYLLWDIDGTLLNFDLAEKTAIRTCFRDFKLGECSDEMLEEYKRINKKYWERLESGEISKKEVLEGRFHDFFSHYGFDVSIVSRI